MEVRELTEREYRQHIRTIRKRRGLTQRQLADILGCTASYISFIERGTRAVTGEPPVIGRKMHQRLKRWLANEPIRTEPTEFKPEPSKGTLHHSKFRALLYYATQHQHTYLYGPPGSGKSTAASQVAKKLDLSYSYVSLNPQTSEFRLIGYRDATGTYQRTAFRDRYEHGGVMCIDELDNANPALLTTLNGMLENGTGDFPDGNVKRHKDFVLIATGNTNGRGATRSFPDRRKMDAATLDRFAFINWEIDEKLERDIAHRLNSDKGLAIVAWVQSVRRWAANHAPQLITSPRVTFRLATTMDCPLSTKDWLDASLFHGLDSDTVRTCLSAVPFNVGKERS